MSLAELYICIYNELRFKIYLQFIDSTDCSSFAFSQSVFILTHNQEGINHEKPKTCCA